MNRTSFINKKSFLAWLPLFVLCLLSVNTYGLSQAPLRLATRVDTNCNANPTVLSSDPTIATASTTKKISVPGKHNLTVNQLARPDQIVSDEMHSQTAPLGMDETITITVINSQMNVKVNVAASDSLQDITNKINNAVAIAHLNVVAYIIEPQPDKVFLMICTTQTGMVNTINVSTENMMLMFNKVSRAQDANFIFDGFDYYSASNNIVIGEWILINLINPGQTTLSVNTL